MGYGSLYYNLMEVYCRLWNYFIVVCDQLLGKLCLKLDDTAFKL